MGKGVMLVFVTGEPLKLRPTHRANIPCGDRTRCGLNDVAGAMTLTNEYPPSGRVDDTCTSVDAPPPDASTPVYLVESARSVRLITIFDQSQ